MARARRSGTNGSSRGRRDPVKGYTLRGNKGRINYVGITNNPERRAKELKSDGKRGKMKVETKGMSRSSARTWEAKKLSNYRRTHNGKNPRHNQTRTGDWKR